MTLGQEISNTLQKELDERFDIVRLSNLAFFISQDKSREISDELYDALFDLILMQEGPEFEMNDFEIKCLIKKIANL